MKLQGYDSARAFLQRIDAQIAKTGDGASDLLPHSNAEEMTSSKMRSMNTRLRFQPDVLDRTRRQR